jgi:hypothetical protein
MGMQSDDGGLFVTSEMAGNQGGKALGPDFLQVLAAMLAECLFAALRAHDADLTRAAVTRKRAVER